MNHDVPVTSGDFTAPTFTKNTYPKKRRLLDCEGLTKVKFA